MSHESVRESQERSVQLQKGCKDLVDVLKKNRRPIGSLSGLAKFTPNAECDYCGGRPVGGLRMLGEEAHFWREQCRQDLTEFARQRLDGMLRFSAGGR